MKQNHNHNKQNPCLGSLLLLIFSNKFPFVHLFSYSTTGCSRNGNFQVRFQRPKSLGLNWWNQPARFGFLQLGELRDGSTWRDLGSPPKKFASKPLGTSQRFSRKTSRWSGDIIWLCSEIWRENLLISINIPLFFIGFFVCDPRWLALGFLNPSKQWNMDSMYHNWINSSIKDGSVYCYFPNQHKQWKITKIVDRNESVDAFPTQRNGDFPRNWPC